jgi:hypothetical protein
VRASSDNGHGGLARVLEGFGLGRGVLWVGSGAVTTVGDVQVAGKKRGGSWGAVSSSPPFSMAWVGAEGAGIDRGIVQEHGYRLETNGDSVLHSDCDLLDFHLPGVRRNARKKFKFENLKFSTLGAQHMSPGFQSYFCYKERIGFAEILFQFLV